MRCFLSYASEDRRQAELINAQLVAEKHNCFFDRDSLQVGAPFDEVIRREVRRADVFIFLISPGSVRDGRYTRTELKLAQEQWPRPHGRVVAVMIEKTAIDSIPAYLAAQNILQPGGNTVAEVAIEVEKLKRRRQARSAVLTAIAVVAVASGIGAGVFAWRAHREGSVANEPAYIPPPKSWFETKPARPADSVDAATAAAKPPVPAGALDGNRPIPRTTPPKRPRNSVGTAAPPETVQAVAVLPVRPAVKFKFFDQALLVPDLSSELADIDEMAHARRWKPASDAMKRLASGKIEPRLWLAAAQIYASWDFPTYREQAEVELDLAERTALSPDQARVARAIRQSLARPQAE